MLLEFGELLEGVDQEDVVPVEPEFLERDQLFQRTIGSVSVHG